VVKKRMFGGRPDDGSSEDAEREAAAELARLTRQARPQSPSPSAGYGGGAGADYRPAGATPPAGGPSLGSPLPVPSFAGPDAEDEDGDDAPFSIRAEEEAVTEMALRDWAAQNRGARSFEDYALVGIDRLGAEAQRDRALREALERQKRMSQEIAARRAEALKQGMGPQAARLPGRVGNPNLGRPNITYATSAPGAMRTNVARQDAIVAAGKERAARAARPKPTGPLLTPAARRVKAAEDEAAAATGAAPKKAKKAGTKKAAAATVTRKAAATKKAATRKATAAAKTVTKKAAGATKATATKAAAKKEVGARAAGVDRAPVGRAPAAKVSAVKPAARKAVAAKGAPAKALPPKAPRAAKAPAGKARPRPAAPSLPPESEDATRPLWPAARRALAAQQEAAAAAAADEQAPPARRRGAGRSPG
jgi:DNA-binding protein HU-beta